MKIINKIKHELKELKDDIIFYLDLEKPDLDKIPTMKREKDIEYIPPLVQLSGKGKRKRIIMKR